MDKQPELDGVNWWNDARRAFTTGDWQTLKLLVAGGIAVVVMVLGIVMTISWLSDNAGYLNASDITSWIVQLVIGGALLIAGLWLLFWIGLAAIGYWQMTIVFVLLGGFIGQGWGAFWGFVGSGIIAWIANKMREHF